MESTYKIYVSVIDNDTREEIWKADFPTAMHSELFADGHATPGLKSVVDFLQKACAEV